MSYNAYAEYKALRKKREEEETAYAKNQQKPKKGDSDIATNLSQLIKKYRKKNNDR